MILTRRQKLTIITLLVYWPGVFILAHIPIPRVVYHAQVSDKTLHILAYLVLVFLLWFSISPDKKANWRKAAVWWILFAVVWYGVIDEVLQGYVGRSCDVTDFLANLAGTLLGLILFSFLSFWPALLAVTGIVIFGLTNLARANMAELLPVTNTLFHLFGYGFFTMLWIQNMRLFLPMKASKWRWIITASALPLGFLLIAKSFSIIFGRYFGIKNVIVGAAGITAVVIAFYIIPLFRKGSAKTL
ncbi:MAG: VanZ family protein [Sedimentisphaerales bacterium]|nr:VanZ family protein [Sedimentisphaerales bacterium]